MFEPGERAFTCTVVDSASAGSGFIIPQSFVDVLVTLKSNRGADDPESRDSVTNLLLQRVQVLAVGQTIAPPKESKVDEKAAKFRTVTLRVKPDQALLLQHAGSMGVLHLVLRHPKDESTDMIKPVGDRMVRLPGSDPLDVAKVGTDPGDRVNMEKALDAKVALLEKSLMKHFDEQYGRGRKTGPTGTDDEVKATPVRVMKGSLTDWIGISFEKPKQPENPSPPNK
jgi:Flp pilus assembly protein CpaB